MLLLTREQEKFAEGFAEGFAQSINEERQRIAADMLKKKLPLSLIVEISKLSETTIKQLPL